MSDRRPENPKLADLRVLTDLGGFEPDDRYVRPGTRPATPADLVSAVRQGVESGAIEGEVVGVRKERNDNLAPNAIYGVLPGEYLLIPVSVGGSET